MSAKRRNDYASKTTIQGSRDVADPGGATHLEERTNARARKSHGSVGAVASRPSQFMIASCGLPGFQPPAALELLEQSLRNNPDVEVLDVLTARKGVDSFGPLSGVHNVLVARIEEPQASIFAGQAGPQITLERDHPLSCGQRVGPPLSITPGNLHRTLGFAANFKVTANEVPVEGAEVSVVGSASVTQGVTDKQGEVELDIVGESPSTIRALYVDPEADCWSVWVPEPAIHTSEVNAIELTPLSATFPGFPKQQLIGWGHKAMKIDQLPPTYRGKGIKIGIIDSGVAATHHILRTQIKSGYDAITRSQEGWEKDVIGQGTHCAGIICGRSPNGSSIQGIAPEAEIIVCRVAPDGSYSSLLDALDFCIAQQVDVIHLGVTGPEPSQLLEQKILQAKNMGIACIAAAGDSGGPVQYPASSPNVLAIAALGKVREFPEQSYHSLGITGFASPSGIFSPHFSCFGPQIGVCGPGVAVVSSVPPDNFAPRDGTAVAAAHITGLAALILAHNPDFQPQAPFGLRTGYRVERLFQLIQQSSQNVNLGNPLRVGAGLPDVTWALAAVPQPGFMTQPNFMPAFAGNPFAEAGFPFSSPNSPLAAQIRPGANPGLGAWPVPPQAGPPGADQGMANFLMAIQQIRAMMQSAGLLL